MPKVNKNINPWDQSGISNLKGVCTISWTNTSGRALENNKIIDEITIPKNAMVANSKIKKPITFPNALN